MLPCAASPLHARPDCAHIIRRLYGGDPADVPNSGPAPALLRFTDLAKVTPLWEQITATIEADKEAVKVLGECGWRAMEGSGAVSGHWHNRYRQGGG